MKKFVTRTLILSVLMIAMLSLSVFGAFASLEGGNVEVTGSYVAGSEAEVVYSVNIVFGAMSFVYTDIGEGDWDPNTHTYGDAVQPGWSCAQGADKVTVSNHSNDDVAVAISYAPTTGYETITGTVANGTFTLPNAEGKAVDAAELTKVVTLSLAGALTGGTEVVLGTLTVALAAA